MFDINPATHIGYTISIKGDAKLVEALNNTINEKGVPVFEKESDALDFGNLVSRLTTALFGFEKAEVLAVPVWRA